MNKEEISIMSHRFETAYDEHGLLDRDSIVSEFTFKAEGRTAEELLKLLTENNPQEHTVRSVAEFTAQKTTDIMNCKGDLDSITAVFEVEPYTTENGFEKNNDIAEFDADNPAFQAIAPLLNELVDEHEKTQYHQHSEKYADVREINVSYETAADDGFYFDRQMGNYYPQDHVETEACDFRFLPDGTIAMLKQEPESGEYYAATVTENEMEAFIKANTGNYGAGLASEVIVHKADGAEISYNDFKKIYDYEQEQRR